MKTDLLAMADGSAEVRSFQSYRGVNRWDWDEIETALVILQGEATPAPTSSSRETLYAVQRAKK